MATVPNPSVMPSVSTQDANAVSAAASTRYRKQTRRQKFMRNASANIAILSALIILGTIVATVMYPGTFNFYTAGNLSVLAQQIPVIAILSLGAGLLMIAGEFDLSIAGVYTLCPFLAALAFNHWGWPFIPSIALAFVIAMAVGFTIGSVTNRLRVPSFIASLGMMFVLRGVVRGVSIDPTTDQPGAISLSPPEFFQNIMAGHVIGPIYAQTVWLALLGIGAWILLNSHAFGNHVYATGGDPEAAEKNGIRTKRTKLIAFMLCSCCAAFAGLMQATRINTIDPGQTLTGLELQAIAAAVIGGTYLFGGRGSILGITLGAVLLVTVENILLLINAPGEFMPVFIGAIIIVSVILNMNVGTAFGRRRY
jgi:simple sugar transport system permease protein